MLTILVSRETKMPNMKFSAVAEGYEPGDAVGFGQTEDEAVTVLIKSLGLAANTAFCAKRLRG